VKAAIVHGPFDLRIEHVPLPEPGPGEVRLRVEAALTGGTAAKVVRRGYHARLGEAPLPLGHEGTGVIDAVGEGIEDLALGERVVPANSAPCGSCAACARGLTAQCEDMAWLLGLYAEAVIVPPRIVKTNLHRVPEGLDAAGAALAENLACVLKGHDRTPVRRGERAVVIGTGALGLLWVRVLAGRGAHVVAVERRRERAEVARALGAAEIEKVGPFEERARRGEVRADLVVECVGSPEAWETAIAAAGPGGRVHFFGGPPRNTTAGLDTQRMHYEELLLASSFHHTPYHFAEAVRLLGEGILAPELLVTERIGLDDLPGFFRRQFEGAGPVKAAVIP
jgi:L-iditol 2-dehydrogenase